MKQYLSTRWHQVWARHEVETSLLDDAFERLYAAYNDPRRGYHGPSHPVQMFGVYDGVAPLIMRRDETQLAIFYHDYYNDPLRNDNEFLSSQHMRNDFRAFGVSGIFMLHVADRIMATDHVADVFENDEKFIRDIDLSSFAETSWENICRNTRGLRHEAPDMSTEEFIERRREKLQLFLDREWLFNTQYFRNHHEKRARSNIALEIKLLPEMLAQA